MIGETFSHYRIVDRIGAGGMGEVFKAEDLDLPRHVALKFLARDMTRDRKLAKRFIREAQAASALDHPNVCTVYEAREAGDGRMYIAMAYYEGSNLRDRLERGEMALDEAIENALAVADGLALAHKKGIIHRDIKPANIMVTNDGVVKILDFGLAKLSGRTRLTTSGTTLGTLAYMSPEQTQDETADFRTDIYSLGVTLYEMITGVCPFIADYEAAIVYKILSLDPTPMRQIRSRVPERLERIVSKAIHKDRNKRYQRIDRMRDDLMEVLQEIAPSRVVRFRSLQRGRARRGGNGLRYAVAGGLVAAATIAAVLNWSTIADWTGIGGLGESKGIAVLQVSRPADATDAVFTTGLGFDLTRRVLGLAEFDDNLWVVPQSQVRNHAGNDPSQADRKLGVDAIITYSLTVEENEKTLQVELTNARTERSIDGFEVSTTSPAWQTDLSRQLADLLDVELDDSQLQSIDNGSTADSRAFESFLFGLGYLESSDEAAPDSAVAVFARALERDSAFALAQVGRARSLMGKNGDTEADAWCADAIAACNAALQFDSTQGIAYEIRGRVRSLIGEKEQALSDFERAVAENRRDPTAWNRFAWTYLELGNYDEAEQAYRDAIAANPYYWGVYADIGYFHYVKGDLPSAISDFQHVVSLAPDHAPTYNYLGAFHYMLEQWDEAILMFEKSFELGKNYEACANLGTLYYMNGLFDDAARMYEWAWEYDRSDHLVIGNLASACYWIPGERERSRSLYEEAVVLAEQALERNPQEARNLAKLAGYYAIVRPAEAAAYAEQALTLAPDDAEILYRAADTYEQLGNRARALFLLGAAIEHGYPVKEIEHEPWLKELREDPRYDLLVSGSDPPAD
jgi:tetratricopeptide (TPR) repeat protein/predicted Ser/Thr protein kinase